MNINLDEHKSMFIALDEHKLCSSQNTDFMDWIEM